MVNEFAAGVVLIIILASMDLWVGVANDAVNFLNSAIGSQIAARKTILLVAAVGVLFGALFSSGMMEVARKGVFNPDFFVDGSGGLNLTAILAVYVGVMAADVVMLDLFNSFGLPTSATVSIISELVGASIAVVYWMNGGDFGQALKVIQTGPVLGIYSGIFVSVIIAFSVAAFAMFILRIIYTHDLLRTFPFLGWAWVSVCLTTMAYFVLFKGLKNASFIDRDTAQWLAGNIKYILGFVFFCGTAASIILRKKHGIIFKFIILGGTFSLAVAFAGNDLVNFIGPAVAAGQAVFTPGVRLSGNLPTPSWALFIAGAIMVSALWRSKKAKYVTDTEVRLAAGGEMEQRFTTSALARALIFIFGGSFGILKKLTPAKLHNITNERTDASVMPGEKRPPYDLLRASVNLTVASMLISIGTAHKLPLSTTYITFMVAMGASLADRSWTAKSAEARITGMLTVIGGWLITGALAAMGAFVMASVIYKLGMLPGLFTVAAIVAWTLIRMQSAHRAMFKGRETVADQV